jgi:HSP20 family protein
MKEPGRIRVLPDFGQLKTLHQLKEEKKRNYHRVERFTGSFYRAFALPTGVDAEQVSATSANGVVTIAIPKKPEAQARKITVAPKV